jgi:hypothetical protein
MSFITHEGKLFFEWCRPYKPTSGLNLGIPTLRLGAADPDVMLLWLFRNWYWQFESPRSANESRSLESLRSSHRNSARLRLHLMVPNGCASMKAAVL